MGLDPTPWTHCAFLPGATVLRKGTLSDMGGGLMGEMEGGGGTKGRREKGVKGETLSDQIFAQCSAHSFIIFCPVAVLRITFFTTIATLSLIP